MSFGNRLFSTLGENISKVFQNKHVEIKFGPLLKVFEVALPTEQLMLFANGGLVFAKFILINLTYIKWQNTQDFYGIGDGIQF